MTKWIKVKDRMPKDVQQVLIWDGYEWREAIYTQSAGFRGATFNPLHPNYQAAITHWAEVEVPNND